MATKKFLEAKAFSDEDLANELNETIAQYEKLKFDHAVKGLEDPLLLRNIRKDIARLKTEMRRREVEAMTPEQLAKRSKIRYRRSK